jgi:hypothetical protein
MRLGAAWSSWQPLATSWTADDSGAVRVAIASVLCELWSTPRRRPKGHPKICFLFSLSLLREKEALPERHPCHESWSWVSFLVRGETDAKCNDALVAA